MVFPYFHNPSLTVSILRWVKRRTVSLAFTRHCSVRDFRIVIGFCLEWKPKSVRNLLYVMILIMETPTDFWKTHTEENRAWLSFIMEVNIKRKELSKEQTKHRDSSVSHETKVHQIRHSAFYNSLPGDSGNASITGFHIARPTHLQLPFPAIMASRALTCQSLLIAINRHSFDTDPILFLKAI